MTGLLREDVLRQASAALFAAESQRLRAEWERREREARERLPFALVTAEGELPIDQARRSCLFLNQQDPDAVGELLEAARVRTFQVVTTHDVIEQAMASTDPWGEPRDEPPSRAGEDEDDDEDLHRIDLCSRGLLVLVYHPSPHRSLMARGCIQEVLIGRLNSGQPTWLLVRPGTSIARDRIIWAPDTAQIVLEQYRCANITPRQSALTRKTAQ